jgi:hypothetical protein
MRSTDGGGLVQHGIYKMGGMVLKSWAVARFKIVTI